MNGLVQETRSKTRDFPFVWHAIYAISFFLVPRGTNVSLAVEEILKMGVPRSLKGKTPWGLTKRAETVFTRP